MQRRVAFGVRAVAPLRKVARTIADLDYSEEIMPKHIYEALAYRMYDKDEI
jgi:magnesium chelatase family protein